MRPCARPCPPARLPRHRARPAVHPPAPHQSVSATCGGACASATLASPPRLVMVACTPDSALWATFSIAGVGTAAIR